MRGCLVSTDFLSVPDVYKRQASNTVKQKSNDLLRLINNHLSKLRLKTQRLNEDLQKARNSDKYRLYGELLTANLHVAKPGDTSVEVISYYDGSSVKIPLDPKYSPAKNAQNFYKKYGKAKTAVKEKQVQLEEVSRQIAYLESVASYAERAETVEETELLRQELIGSGYIRYRKNRKGQERKNRPRPLSYILSSGKTVPVSYTHLDVYKRQYIYCRWSPGIWCCRPSKLWHPY